MAPIAQPGVLQAGDDVRFDGRLHTVVALSGTSARLVDNTGATTLILLPQLLGDPSFALISASRPPLPPLGALDGLPKQVVEQAQAGGGAGALVGAASRRGPDRPAAPGRTRHGGQTRV